MKLDHLAGEEIIVDFAGKKLHVIDKETGELISAEVFVAILAAVCTPTTGMSELKKGDDLVELSWIVGCSVSSNHLFALNSCKHYLHICENNSRY